jgi:hypothetical protein
MPGFFQTQVFGSDISGYCITHHNKQIEKIRERLMGLNLYLTILPKRITLHLS